MSAETDFQERSGKDVTFWNQTIKKSFERVGTYYYVLPTYRQARKILINQELPSLLPVPGHFMDTL